MTVSEYFRLQEIAEERHAYWDGEIQMNQGGTYQHSTVIANTIISIGSRLRRKPCRVTESNTRVAQTTGKRYVYPDAVVVCGEPKLDPADKKPTTILNPPSSSKSCRRAPKVTIAARNLPAIATSSH